jgi:MinD-like ATPase involved in chromosome partitioning or flagellar assembly
VPGLGQAAERELSSDQLLRRRPSRDLRFPFGRDQAARLAERVRTPLRRCYRVAVLGHTAATGRTVTTAVLGALLATNRHDRVIALDLGTDAAPAPRPEPATRQDLRRLAAQRPGGLELLAAAASDEPGYRQLLESVAGQYPLVLSDTGAAPAAVRAAVATADQLVVCTGASVRGAAGTEGLLDWLTTEGHGSLVAGAVLVVSPVAGRERALPGDGLAAHFGTRCRGVVTVPFDSHLAAGGELLPDRLRSRTRNAYLEAAALLGDGMAARA